MNDYAAPERARFLSQADDRAARMEQLVAFARHVGRILVLAHIAAIWVGALVLVDINDRRVDAEEKLAREKAEQKRWSCTEFTGRWPMEGKPIKVCHRQDANRSY